MERIRQEGKKEGVEKDVMDGIAAAIDVMSEVNDFVNAYVKDSDYIEDTDLVFQRASVPFEFKNFDYKFMGGYMEFSAKVQLRLLSDQGKFLWYQIFAFEEFVLIFKLVDRGIEGSSVEQ